MDGKYRIYGMQQYLINLTDGKDTCVVNPAGLRIKGKLDLKRLEDAVQETVNENDALRFVFGRDEKTGGLYQRVLDEYPCRLKKYSVEGRTDEEREQFIIGSIRRAMTEVSYLPDGKVKWDIILYEYPEDEYMLWCLGSHLIADGLSVMNLLAKVILHYNGQPVPESGSYLDFIQEQYRIEADPECEKMRTEYMASTADYKDPVDMEQIGNRADPYRFISVVETDQLKDFVRKNKMSMFHAALFLSHAAISAAFGCEDSLIGVAVGTRKMKNMFSIGDFLTGFGDRMQFTPDMSMREAAVACKTRYLQESRKDYGAYRCFGDGCLFMVAYQNYTGGGEAPSFENTETDAIEDYSKYMVPYQWKSLCIDIYEDENALAFMGGYDASVFTGEIMARMNAGFQAAASCLSGEDMTYREFCSKVDSMLSE